MVQVVKKVEDDGGQKVGSVVVCRICGMTGDHWTLKYPLTFSAHYSLTVPSTGVPTRKRLPLERCNQLGILVVLRVMLLLGV